MYKKVLLQANLTHSQAEILDFLYQNKKAKASEIAKKIKRSRAIVYKEVEELANLGIIERIDKVNQVSFFKANHPSQLKKLLDLRENKLKKDRELLNSYLPDIISNYNLINNKPGIRFFEGKEGVWTVLKDTLNAKTEILTIVDVEAVDKYIKTINKQYVKKRNKLGIKKRLLVLDSAFAREHFKNANEKTDVKLLKLNISPFSTSVQIYDNKIAYITMTQKNLFSTIIEDPFIYSMNKALFNSIWDNN